MKGKDIHTTTRGQYNTKKGSTFNQTYCNPTDSCTAHLWFYSDLHNNDPDEEAENPKEEGLRKI